MNVIEAIYRRRAVRSYAEKEVDRTTITELLKAAVQAPSAINLQPWAFAVIQDRKLLPEYSERAKRHALTTLATHPQADHLRAILAKPDFDIFYHAPALIIICAKPAAEMTPEEDCSLAAQNLMLAATEMGLATCPIGFARLWLNLAEVKQELGIPADFKPVFPVIVGYQKDPAPPVERKKPEVIFWK
jgi:nitroreductase